MKNATLYKFWAPWCGPCRVMKPTIEKVLQNRPNIVLVEINVDEKMEMANQFGVQSIPAFVLDVDGKRFTKVGSCREDELALFLDQAN